MIANLYKLLSTTLKCQKGTIDIVRTKPIGNSQCSPTPPQLQLALAKEGKMSENTNSNSDRRTRSNALRNLQRDFSLARLQNMGASGVFDETSIRAQLLKLVECPVCYESMTETEMCVNGHTVCVRCRSQLSICPVCNKAFSNIRNRLGEGVSELLAFKPCSNACRGCPKYLAEKDCRKHELGCTYRLYPCKVCSTQLCFLELKDHILRNHESSILEPFITRELTSEDFVEGQTHFSLIEFNGETFWFWWKHSEVNTFFGLQYCGEADKCSSYRYNFQLISQNEKSDFEFTGPVLADSLSAYKYKFSEDYAVLSKAFFSQGAKYQVSVARTD